MAAEWLTLKVTRRQLEGIHAALDSDIPARRQAAFNDLGERTDHGPEAIDAIVPAQEQALTRVEKLLHREEQTDA